MGAAGPFTSLLCLGKNAEAQGGRDKDTDKETTLGVQESPHWGVILHFANVSLKLNPPEGKEIASSFSETGENTQKLNWACPWVRQ